MLKELDLRRIAKSLTAKGFRQFEVYAEQSRLTHAEYFDRADRVSLTSGGGISVRAIGREQVHYFSTTDFSTAGIISAIESKAERSHTHKKEPTFVHSPQKFVLLTEFYRSLFNPSHAVIPTLAYEEEIRKFEVVSSEDEKVSFGGDERAQLRLQWYSPKEGRYYHVPWYRRSIEGLLSDLSTESSLHQAFQSFLAPPIRWPIPSGEINAVWSSLATAKILLPLMRLCEADQNFGADNFWEKNEGLPSWFSLSDTPDEKGGCDYQGVPRAELKMVESGKLKRFACDRNLAFELNCTPTGHGRRERFNSPVGVGLWNARLDGPRNEEPLLEKMGNGIFVNDLDLIGWHPHQAVARVTLKDGRLVHHGELGEYLEPATVDLPLSSLLKAFTAMGPVYRTRGFRIFKPQGYHITEVSTPDLMTTSIPFAGTVPASHYW